MAGVVASVLLAAVAATPLTVTAAAASSTVPDGLPAAILACSTERVDLNTATASLITTVPGIPSFEVATRLVGLRPFASLDHLPAVNGIGPAELSTIKASNRACISLPTTPPPVFDPCPGQSDDLDLNTVSRATAADIFGGPTADRLRAMQSRPMWKVRHATALAGIGPGSVSKYKERLCVTPPTVQDPAAATSWTWANDASGVLARSDDQQASLSVPAGAISRSLWVRVENMVRSGTIAQTPEWSADLDARYPTREYAPPTFDTSLVPAEGGELQPEAPVQVTLPVDQELVSSDLVPIVRHYDANGDWEVFRDRAQYAASAGTISASLTNLSPSVSTFATLAPVIFMPTDGNAATNKGVWDGAIAGATPGETSCPNPSTFDADKGVLEVESLSSTRDFSYCSYFDNNFGTWKVRNNRNGPVRVSGDSSSGFVRADGSTADQVLTRVLLDNTGTVGGQWEQDGRGVWLAPSDVASYQLRQHGESRITIDSDGDVIHQYMGSLALLEGLGITKAVSSDSAALYYLAQCGYADNPVGCVFGTSVEDLVKELVEKGLIKLTTKAAAKRILFVYSSYMIARTADAISPNYMSVRYDRPSAPTVDARGRSIPESCRYYDNDAFQWVVNSACVDAAHPVSETQPRDGATGGSSPTDSPGSRFLIKLSDGRQSYVLDNANLAHHIPDGLTYLCNADYLPTWFDVDPDEYLAVVAGTAEDAGCPSGTKRSLYPDTVANFLLRTPGGDVYFVGTNGRRVPLFSGSAVFSCMADRYLVWDQVTPTELDRFMPDPSVAATGC